MYLPYRTTELAKTLVINQLFKNEFGHHPPVSGVSAN
jgi:hypothetical protein